MADTYSLTVNGVNPAPISGRFLAFNRYDLIARAFFGADLVRDKRRLKDPTILQAAKLCRVNPTYLHWALRRQDERRDIELGLIPLVPPKSVKTNGAALAATLTPEVDPGLVEIVRTYGVGKILDAAVIVESAQ